MNGTAVLVIVQTMKQLQHMNLSVPMSSTVPWTLNKTHVKVAFRMCVSMSVLAHSHEVFHLND